MEGNTAVYRASAVGHCLRMLWAARNGMEATAIPAPIQKAMDEGTDLEQRILTELYEKHDFTYGYQGQQFQVELDCGTWNGIRCIVRGAVDEIGHVSTHDMGDLTVDVKAFGQKLVDEYRTKGIMGLPRYAWQQSAYAQAFGKSHFYMPIWNKAKEEVESWSLLPILIPYSAGQIRDRIMTVEEAVANNKMPEECPAEYGCQYFYLHDKPTVDTLPDKAQVLLIARINLDNKITTLSKARDTLNNAIKAELTKDVTYHLHMDETPGQYTITVIANPDKFNTNAAKQLLTEASVDWQNDPEFIVPGVGTQLRVTKPRGKAAS